MNAVVIYLTAPPQFHHQNTPWHHRGHRV